jgi:N-acetylglutamate synthase-like GNAT family acetyltransferase
MIIEYLKNKPEYIEEIAHHMFSEWGHLRKNINVNRFLNALNSRLNDDKIPFTLIAISKSKELIGFASIVENDMDINRELKPWISGVYIKSEFRNKGMGQILVDKLEEKAKNLGLKKLYLFTFDKEKFYNKLGWNKIKNDFYLDLDVTLMSKIL